MTDETPVAPPPSDQQPVPETPPVKQPPQPSPELLDDKLVPVYVSYVVRITEHYKIGLQQFQVYFGFNAALFVLLGFILKPFLNPPSPSAPPSTTPTSFALPPEVLALLVGASLVGILLTRHWRVVMQNSMRLQLYFNETLALWENRLLRNSKDGFYNRLNTLYPPHKHPKDDLIDINVRVTWVFTWAWTVVGIGSSVALSLANWRTLLGF